MSSLNRPTVHGYWRSRWTFVAAATASAVGLGNVWKFSYVAGENGGGAFVLLYLACVLIIGVPVLIAEVTLGSRGRSDPIHTMESVTLDRGGGRFWHSIGWLGCGAALLILSYYSVVAGWAMAYVEKMSENALLAASARLAGQQFGELLGQPWEMIRWHSLFMAGTALVVALGINRGLGMLLRVVVPLFLLLLGYLVYHAYQVGDMSAAINFLFAYDSTGLTVEAAVMALGHTFFTLSVGMGVMMTFGAYLPDGRSIGRMVLVVALLDTVVALMAGLAVFALVFTQHIEPGMGPGLMFVSLPYVFGNIPNGDFVGTLFFCFVVLVAWGSAISLLEPGTAWLVQRTGWPRFVAAIALALLVWLLGLITVLSFNEWREWRIGELSLFGAIDFVTASVALPLGGFLLAVYVGWFMRREPLRDELFVESNHFFTLWRGVLRYVAVPAMAVVLAASLYQRVF